ncbi:14411_t:CDS:2 [Funneliformis geosporum]|nr:14411_t:CDS:2 [Funneliformis geosporum]
MLDSQRAVDKKLEAIREHLKIPYKGVVRFQGKTPEQISKERYDKVLEEVNFEYDKLHEWLYQEENKDKVEIVKDSILIDWASEKGNTNKVGGTKYSSVIIFLHGTYGSRGVFEEMEQKLPHTKIIYPYSPTLQYDMWHGAAKAPGGQCQG